MLSVRACSALDYHGLVKRVFFQWNDCPVALTCPPVCVQAFGNFSDNLLQNLDWSHVFVAGGAVIYNLLTSERRDWYKYVSR